MEKMKQIISNLKQRISKDINFKNKKGYYQISIPLLKVNHISYIDMQINSARDDIKFYKQFKIFRYQENLKFINHLSKANEFNVKYSNPTHSSIKANILVTKKCHKNNLGTCFFNYIFNLIEIHNYLIVNSYLDKPNTLEIQKLHLI